MCRAFKERKISSLLRGTVAAAVMAAIFLPLPAWAEPSPPAEAKAEADTEEGVFNLGTVFSVLAREELQTVSEQMESSIAKTKIDLFEDKTIDEALSRIPGVRFARPSGGRYESGVYIRGFSAYGNSNSSVPMFIDGIPAYVPYDYTMDMGRFTTGDVAAVSVSKGYSSVLYGPNALGGVINVISQRPIKKLYGNFTIGLGEGNTTEANGVIGTLQDKWYAQVSMAYLNREFIRAADKYTGIDAIGEGKDTNRKNYGTRDKKVTVKFAYIPNDNDEYAVTYLRQRAQKGPKRDSDNCSSTTNPECWATGYMETWWEWPIWDRETISFVSSTRFGNLYVKPRIFYDKYDNSLYGWGRTYASRDDSRSQYDDYAWGGEIEVGTEKFENNVLKGKFSYKFNQHTTYSVEGHDGAPIEGLNEKLEEQIVWFALEDTYRFSSNWELQVGLLYSRRQTTHAGEGLNIMDLIDEYPDTNFGITPPDIDAWDPEGVLFYKPTKNHTFHYAFAKKTRFPSMRNQYSNYGAGDTYGNTGLPLVTIPNPGLKPERALHQEFGWQARFFNRLSTSLDLFHSINDDVIDRSGVDTTTYPGFAVQQVINVTGDTRRIGLDFGIDYLATDNIAIGSSISCLRSTNKDNNAWRATHPAYNGSLYASVKLNDWVTLVPVMDYYGRSRYSSTGINRWSYNPGTALIDLKMTVTPPMNKSISINVGAENVFDTDYRDWNAAYPSPGRYIYANLRYRL